MSLRFFFFFNTGIYFLPFSQMLASHINYVLQSVSEGISPLKMKIVLSPGTLVLITIEGVNFKVVFSSVMFWPLRSGLKQ